MRDRVSDVVAAVVASESVTEAELLRLVTGANPDWCEKSLAEAGGLRALLNLPDAAIRGGVLTDAQVARLIALRRLASTWATQTLVRGASFHGSADIFRHFHATMRDLKLEQFRVVLIDGKHRVIRDVLVSQGTLTSSPVHPREVFAPAVRESAAAVVLIHNHPSGDPSPSADDLEITRRLVAAGDLIGIRVLDHVIIGDGAYTSLADRGLMGGGR